MILWWYLGMVSVLLLSLCLPTPPPLAIFHLDLTASLTYTILCSITFFVGYICSGLFLPKMARADSVILDNRSISTGQLLFFSFLAASGLTILLLQINATVGIARYILLLADSNATNDLRYATVALSSSEGGLPGYIKMFNCNSSISVFCLLSLVALGYRIRGAQNLILAFFICTFYIASTAIRMDRLSVLALVPIVLSIVSARELKFARWAAIAGGLLMVLGIVAQSIRRDSELGIGGWIALYFQLGTVNLELLMRPGGVHTYGMAGLFSIANWTLRVFGIDMMPSSDMFQWAWAPAQNGFGYMFLDFSWFGCLVLLTIGMISGWIDLEAQCRRNSEAERAMWKVIQWAICFGVASMVVVPAFSGIEYWLLLILSPIIVKRIVAVSVARGA